MSFRMAYAFFIVSQWKGDCFFGFHSVKKGVILLEIIFFY